MIKIKKISFAYQFGYAYEADILIPQLSNSDSWYRFSKPSLCDLNFSINKLKVSFNHGLF